MLCFEIELYVCWYQSVFDIWCNTQYIELPGVPTLVGTYAMCLPKLAHPKVNIWCSVPSSVDVKYDIHYGGLGNWVVFMLISKCFQSQVQYSMYWAARCSYPSWNMLHGPTLVGTQQQHLISCRHLISCTFKIWCQVRYPLCCTLKLSCIYVDIEALSISGTIFNLWSCQVFLP